jgi:Rps23 Pro-64 3,4-dihydroxylase Tpa1-like proline 4-hydroxylase
MGEPRQVSLRIQLAGGHEHTVTLAEDAPELLALFTTLAVPGSEDGVLQLPLDGGRAACTFRKSQLVSIVSEPPVLADLSKAPAPEHAGRPMQIRRPRFVVIDDFLGPLEHRELLAYALASEEQFKAGTVSSYDPEHRQNLVVVDFGSSAHSQLIQNRLLIWFPLIARTLGMPVFPLASVESQLTAAGEGHFFKVHSDDGPGSSRVLSCVYYLHRRPRGFAGGELRFYDRIDEGGSRRPAETFTAVDPVANRMVVFPSVELHEVMPVRCPSGEFADSRFAITNWLHRAAVDDPAATFGWGHFRCGTVAPQFRTEAHSGAGES